MSFASLSSIARRLISTEWMLSYRREDLPSDLLAGTTVAIMLVPQAMAYAVLAGLPPEIGLYASVLPLLVYPLFATSRYLAVGPVAIVSLLVASSVSQLAGPGTRDYVATALLLALMVGAMQFLMGLLRLGFLVNFLSHSVIAGFTSAAAFVIGLSQLKHVFGISVGRGEFFEVLREVVSKLSETNFATLLIGIGALAVLAGSGGWLERMLVSRGLSERGAGLVCKAAPLVVVAVSTVLVSSLTLHSSRGVAIVGEIPSGLPPFSLPIFDLSLASALLPAAAAISFVGFLESYAVAQSLAIRHREKVDANRELMALGIANFGAAVSSGYPVTGGFSRSMVNHSAGARSGLASIVSAVLIALTLLLLTPLFYYLPMAVLAAIILVAVSKLVDFREPFRLFRYSKADGFAFLVSFVAVLWLGLEKGVLVGAGTALVLHLWHTSRPHIAVVGRVGTSEHFRNVCRHQVETWPELLLVRIDESLYFANAAYLEDYLLRAVADRPQVRQLVLIASAVNFIDGSALETLEGLIEKLASANVTMHLAEVKGPVMDRIERTHLLEHLAPGKVYLSVHEAVDELLARGGAESRKPSVSMAS